jgi:hypothetical protein
VNAVFGRLIGKWERHADLTVGVQHDEVAIFKASKVLGRRYRTPDEFCDFGGSRSSARVGECLVDVAAKIKLVHPDLLSTGGLCSAGISDHVF